MSKERPILLIALAAANWSFRSYAQEADQGNINVAAVSTVESKTIRTLTRQDQSDEKKGLPFGNLRKINLSGIGGRLVLNGLELEKVTSDSIDLESAKQEFRVRATFLKTVMVKDGEAVDSRDKQALEIWRKCIPEIARVLRNKDSLGSLKPVVYELIEPNERTDLQI